MAAVDLHYVGAPLRGIINYLTERYNGNVHDKGAVNVTGGHVVGNNPKLAVKNIADLREDTWSRWSRGSICPSALAAVSRIWSPS